MLFEDEEPDTITLTQTQVNRLAQRFYEASRLPMLMTDKPLVVNGLLAVFEEIGVTVEDDTKETYVPEDE